MKAICTFCGEFLRWEEPFDEPGIIHQTCENCREPEPEPDPWSYYLDLGGEG